MGKERVAKNEVLKIVKGEKKKRKESILIEGDACVGLGVVISMDFQRFSVSIYQGGEFGV